MELNVKSRRAVHAIWIKRMSGLQEKAGGYREPDYPLRRIPEKF
ncbi:hypothetical protein ACVK1X_003147 [Pseudomonas sp. PvR086]|jgi:hypothetical protein|nr:hypothetical protein PGR6_28600 [Pseudomonas sp. GR 6-02]MDR7104696.1 hypothetical protein [Pseudomonas frederiksbergensis]PZW64964.1 hypothetical protein F475_01037 [Pseudomonas sp. URMO17WK12:I6]CAH0171695.1 hypothetical protein SRABI130_01288 [Pseudomonas sp. Bi130]